MNPTRPTSQRRTSRVRFNDEVFSSAPAPGLHPMLTNSPEPYAPQFQRWSIPTAQYTQEIDFPAQARYSLQSPQTRHSQPAVYRNADFDAHRGRSRDLWPVSQPMRPQPFRSDSPEKLPSRRRTSRVPVHTLPVPSEPHSDRYGHCDSYPSKRRSSDSHDRRGSDTTLTGDDMPYDKFTSLPARPVRRVPRDSLYRLSDNYEYRFPDPQQPARSPGQPLRSAMRRSYSEVSNHSETRGPNTSPHERGVLSNMMSLTGLKGRPRAISASSAVDYDRDLESGMPSLSRMGLRRRHDSTMSTGSGLLDPDDPRVTGLEDSVARDRALKATEEAFDPNEKQQKPKKDKAGDPVNDITNMVQRQAFILRLAKALMYFGSPSHRIESQLVSVSRTLDIDAQFVHMPSIVICSFGDQETKTSETHFVKAGGRLMLGKLHNVHNVYRSVVHGQMDAKEGSSQLSKLLKSPPLYSVTLRSLFAFLCCFLICPMAFRGSLADALISGLGGALLSFLQLVVAHKNAMYADVFEISIAILMSFAARALTAVPNHIFCYQAISSSAVVLILPGYLILCSSLELASKNMLTGSVRMVYAIIYSLFLGFGLTIGSDLAFLVIPSLRQSHHSFANVVSLHGQFNADNATSAALSSFVGSFTFNNATMLAGQASAENLLEGCYRNPHSLFLLQAFPKWTLFFLVPLYSLISSLWNLQPLKSRQLPVMVFISCASYAANYAANEYIFNRSDVVSAIGAFVVGILGNVYSRLFGGTAFQVMSVAVCFLIPSGIAATGGLSDNYRGHDSDSYLAGLSIGLRMVQVSIGITVGLFGSGLVVYSFGSRKKNALFAF